MIDKSFFRLLKNLKNSEFCRGSEQRDRETERQKGRETTERQRDDRVASV